jgi:DNA polymerase-3 subunit alpha
MIYQEQVMQVAVALAGFSMGQADTLRKAMGKKKLDVLMPFKEQFIAGAVGKGYPHKLAADLFEMIVPFADYGFNASHACAYGYVAYQTAYLMAHHPVEYMASILTSVKDDKDRKPYYLYACRGMGIEVLPPDVNGSETDFAPAPGAEPAIRYGLSAVRNVGEGAVAKIIEARGRDGAFTSFSDFCRKVDPGVLTKRVLESLVQAGAFDSLGYTRQGLLQAQDKVSGPIVAERKAEAAGQFSLFGGGDDAGAGEIDESVLEADEFDKRTLLRLEKEMLGQFVTDHPLLEVRDVLAAKCSHEIADLDSLGDGDLVTIGGIIGAVSRKYTKRGEPYAQFRLEGLAGGVDVVAFPSVYEAVPGMIETDRIVLATGRIDLRGRELQIRATEVREPDLGASMTIAAEPEALVVDLPASACTPSVLAKLKDLFEAHPGGALVRVRFLASTGVTPLEVGSYRVHPAGPLLGELRSLLGGDAARLEREPPDQAEREPAPAR